MYPVLVAGDEALIDPDEVHYWAGIPFARTKDGAWCLIDSVKAGEND